MRLLRGLLGALLWILAAVVGLVGLVLCVTVILLPLGIPMVMLAGRLFTHAVKFMMPRSLAHPIDELTKTTKKKGRKIRSVSSDAVADTAKKARKVGASSASLLLEAPA
jgi:hypothetical protein